MACVELYGVVMVNVLPVVAFFSTIVHTFDPGTASPIVTVMESPARTGTLVIFTLGAGISSHHAEYEAAPDFVTSCSVPAWISVLSVTLQAASTHPPPMPTHVEEYSASPALCGRAVGTFHVPDTEEKSMPAPPSSVPWL